MKVSIIIPVYNVGSYIKRCLESVANQSYSDIECIMVDDCGNDNSCRHYARRVSLPALGRSVAQLVADAALDCACMVLRGSLRCHYPFCVVAGADA